MTKAEEEKNQRESDLANARKELEEYSSSKSSLGRKRRRINDNNIERSLDTNNVGENIATDDVNAHMEEIEEIDDDEQTFFDFP